MENQTKSWTYLVLDLEMTGLDPFQHWVIEVGAIVLDEFFEIIWEFQIDLLPPDDIVIDPASLEYNGFTMDRIAKWVSYPDFCDLWNAFLTPYFDGEKKPIMIGQFIVADLAFMMSIFSKAKRSDLFQKLWNDIIDTKSIANQHNAIARYHRLPLPFTSTSLSKPGGIADSLHITGYDAHTAKWDITATREALMKFLNFKQ